MKKRLPLTLAGLVAANLWLTQGTGYACAVCFGKSDSRMMQGMTWGVLFLLSVVVVVLGSVALFFAYLVRRARAYPGPTESLAGGAIPTYRESRSLDMVEHRLASTLAPPCENDQPSGEVMAGTVQRAAANEDEPKLESKR